MSDDGTNPFAGGRIPRWVSAWGHDDCGVWAAFEIEGVRQALRWIRPGTFLMGSPVDEPGRRENEGPQHQATFSRGFWLADTPCTQALWCAVMGDDTNRSRFGDPRRPVENVSFDDVQAFLAACERRVPGLGLRLPLESEWEYACRAGTTDATYAGPIEILGANNAPVLDHIAWYSGNSGVGFELEEGYDSSDWPEKQYPHAQAGTHPVKQRLRNAWGLHDTLGNVWEWCANDRDAYPDTEVFEPDPLTFIDDKRRYRVVRGGSWISSAQSVRAAYRDAHVREGRDVDVGFRFARGRVSGGRGPEGHSRTAVAVGSGSFVGGRSPSGASPERPSKTSEGIPGPLAPHPHWLEDEDQWGVYADVVVPETKVSFRMRLIQPGTFMMGSPDDDPEAFDREKPQHSVTLTQGFWLADTPCTQAVYEAITSDKPSRSKGAEHPVEQVSWEMAQAFVQGLSEAIGGESFILPTEAQ
ncbi:MAG: SUMF1/EgtB/PvdO family nonheme iron enzyme, partial [Myxococcota bacterium]